MPVILVYGIPGKFDQTLLRMFWDELRKTTASIEELKLTEEQVSAFFPADLLQEGLGEEIIFFVFGLLAKPERTSEVRNNLAQKLAATAKVYFPEAMTECFIIPFDPEQGFATIPANLLTLLK